MNRARIEIVHPDPTWPDQFRALASALRRHLGQRAVRIDHIGSTSVPNLAAKDRLDLQVTVDDLDDPRLPPAVQACGLQWRPDVTEDHRPPGRELAARELTKRFASSPRANVHVRCVGRFNQVYPLLCRDYLRAHPFAAKAYEEVKRQLARRFAEDATAYYDVKDPVFDLIMEGAYVWRDHVGWSPGPSDA